MLVCDKMECRNKLLLQVTDLTDQVLLCREAKHFLLLESLNLQFMALQRVLLLKDASVKFLELP